jgi:hypothetical protein
VLKQYIYIYLNNPLKFGLAQHFHYVLKSRLNAVDHMAISFDESLNKISQRSNKYPRSLLG